MQRPPRPRAKPRRSAEPLGGPYNATGRRPGRKRDTARKNHADERTDGRRSEAIDARRELLNCVPKRRLSRCGRLSASSASIAGLCSSFRLIRQTQSAGSSPASHNQQALSHGRPIQLGGRHHDVCFNRAVQRQCAAQMTTAVRCSIPPGLCSL